ncbi:hypothetical protein N0B44_08215 [Roseibacterium beibuensis]|uniref:hypothetical protein n=1 Tax=[Roseibacterium] beibuensis TaxID=1193142 RepID=UPI00217EF23A|nr:hypothetical protein [Roseibacterium beibuensis]MCS6622890.1 hypothetical protein [Roseibacterium beibuensis]
MKSVVIPVLAAVFAVTSAPAPAVAQDIFPGFVVARVCLPYASRAKTFESAIRAARDMEFRRPAGDRAPLEDWASEVELVSKDGRWRLRIEEGSVEQDGVEVYAVTCGVSSNLASSRELGQVARRMVGRSPLWSQQPDTPWRWDRRTTRSTEYALRIDVTEEPGQRPVLAARGLYY